MNPSAIARSAIPAIALFAAPLAQGAEAQERPSPVVEFAAGVLEFPDNAVVSEGFVGGDARFFVLPRVSIGPEVTFVAGKNHSHAVLTGNVTFDFRPPAAGVEPTVAPYSVVGVGIFQTRERFPGNQRFTSAEAAFTAGGGVRFRAARRLTAGVEARVGWELHLRLNATIGVRLGQ